ncbi:MAG: TetR/AcrR family transcriptional regulator [Ilumatobacteraceae bacterium]
MNEPLERRRALTKGERTRERLLRAAIDRFGADGFRATSVSQLSRDAGLTPAAAYAYFDDKDALWRSAIAADLDALRTEIAGAALRDERPILALMLGVISGMQRHALARRVLVEGSLADLQFVLTHPIFADLTTLLAAGLTARQERGVLPAEANPAQLALGMESVIFSLVLASVRAGMESEPDRVEAVVALLYAAAGGPPTPQERVNTPMR